MWPVTPIGSVGDGRAPDTWPPGLEVEEERFQAVSGWQSHIPDFLAVTATGVLLADVRPGDRIGSDDLVRFAASTRLKMHREADQDALDLLRSLMSMHATLVLIGVGIPGPGLLREGRRDPRTGQWALPPARRARRCNDEAATQTERRFNLINLGPFRYDTPAGIAAWVTHLTGIEQHLRLFRAAPGMLTGNTMPEYLFRRTNGIVGLLERLVEDGCALAISDGTERLTTGVLDQVDINLGNVPGRDPCAGEIPRPRPGPPPPPAARKLAHAASGPATPDRKSTRLN